MTSSESARVADARRGGRRRPRRRRRPRARPCGSRRGPCPPAWGGACPRLRSFLKTPSRRSVSVSNISRGCCGSCAAARPSVATDVRGTGAPMIGDEARLERQLVTLRWLVAAFGAARVVFAIRDHGRDPAFALPLAVALVIGLAVGNLAISSSLPAGNDAGAASVRSGSSHSCSTRWSSSCLIWLAPSGPADPVWAFGYLVPLEGAARWGLRGRAARRGAVPRRADRRRSRTSPDRRRRPAAVVPHRDGLRDRRRRGIVRVLAAPRCARGGRGGRAREPRRPAVPRSPPRRPPKRSERSPRFTPRCSPTPSPSTSRRPSGSRPSVSAPNWSANRSASSREAPARWARMPSSLPASTAIPGICSARCSPRVQRDRTDGGAGPCDRRRP